MSSGASSASSSSSSLASSPYTYDSRVSMDSQPGARVETLRCSRCAKCVEIIVADVGGDDIDSSGMVKFGHNLYYCDRCARMVGYK